MTRIFRLSLPFSPSGSVSWGRPTTRGCTRPTWPAPIMSSCYLERSLLASRCTINMVIMVVTIIMVIMTSNDSNLVTVKLLDSFMLLWLKIWNQSAFGFGFLTSWTPKPKLGKGGQCEVDSFVSCQLDLLCITFIQYVNSLSLTEKWQHFKLWKKGWNLCSWTTLVKSFQCNLPGNN